MRAGTRVIHPAMMPSSPAFGVPTYTTSGFTRRISATHRIKAAASRIGRGSRSIRTAWVTTREDSAYAARRGPFVDTRWTSHPRLARSSGNPRRNWSESSIVTPMTIRGRFDEPLPIRPVTTAACPHRRAHATLRFARSRPRAAARAARTSSAMSSPESLPATQRASASPRRARQDVPPCR